MRALASRWLTGLHAYTDTLAQRRPLWMVSLAIDETNLSEGLRAACASSAMLLLGLLFDHPDFSWAAIGAFWTCLADAAGTRRMRFVSMVGFGLLSTVAGGLAALAAGHGLATAALAVLLFSWAGALARIWGAATAQVAILAATACVVMVTHPLESMTQSAPFLGLYMFGCLFATVLSFTVWRIHPFGPSRRAVRAAYSRLAGIARDNARFLQGDPAQPAGGAHGASYRSQARAALEAARVALAAVPPARAGRSALYDNLLLALSDAERIFAYLIAVTHTCEREQHRLRRVVLQEARIVARDAGQARVRGADGAPAGAERVDAPHGKAEHGGKQAAKHVQPQEGRALRHRVERMRDHHHAGRGRQDRHLRRGRAPDARQRAGPGKHQHGDGRRRQAMAGGQRGQAAHHGGEQAEAHHRDKTHAPRARRVGQAGPEGADGGPGKVGMVE